MSQTVQRRQLLNFLTVAGWLERSIGLSLILLIIISSLVDFVPFSPSFPADNLDSSWQFALNAAVTKKLAFGQDIVFTLGPYASVYTAQYHPGTDRLMFWGSCLLAAALAAALLCLTKGAYRLIALSLTLFLATKMRDTQLLAIPFLALLLICQIALPPNHPSRIKLDAKVVFSLALMVLALSLLPLVKGTFAIGSGLVMATGFILFAIRGHGILALGGSALFMSMIAVFWVLAGQSLNHLPDYFLTIRPVISGYAAAMSNAGPKWQIEVFLACGLVIGVLDSFSLRGSGAARIFLLAGSAAILFLSFKEGFVRDDGHSMIAGGMLGLAGWIMLLARRGYVPSIVLVIALGGWAAIGAPYDGGITKMLLHGEIAAPLDLAAQNLSTPFTSAYSGSTERLKNGDALRQQYDAALSRIRSGQPIPALSGTTDDYSADQSILLANGLDWDPRPLIQSYVAYTAELEQQDAAHLAGPNPPDNILFKVDPIDGRLPALEDAASWPALLNRYDITGFRNGIAFLRISPISRATSPISAEPSLSGIFSLGQQLELPRNTSIVWAKIDVRPTLLGRALGLLFKPPHLNISYIFPDGTTQSFRYIAGMGVSGFVAAPLVQDTSDFLALTLPDSDGFFEHGRPASISITSGHGGGLFWQRSFKASFYAMTVPVQAAAGSFVFHSLASQQFAGALPILPGHSVIQRFKPPPQKFSGISIRFVTWGRPPTSYTFEWRIDATSNGQTIKIGGGKLDAAAITDWEKINLPLAGLPKTIPDQITLTFWGDGKVPPTAPAGVPVYQPLNGDPDPAVETDRIAAPNRAQIGLIPYLNQ